MPPTGDPANKPCISPDGESNLRPLHAWDNAQSTGQHWPGLMRCNFKLEVLIYEILKCIYL